MPASTSTEGHDSDKGYYQSATGWVDWLYTGPNKNVPQVGNSWTRWWGAEVEGTIERGSLWDYVRDKSSYLCPEFAREDICGRADPGRSYVMNSQASYIWLYNLRDPAKRLLFSELSVSTTFKGTPIASRSGNVPSNPNSASRTGVDASLTGTKAASQSYPVESIATYHRDEVYGVFCDGHVERLSWSNTISRCSGNW